MPRAPQLLILAAALLLAACESTGDTRRPPAESATAPVAVPVVRQVFVPIDAALTAPEPVAEGPLAECPRVAAERRAALERANAKLRAIAAQQGTEVGGQ